MSRYRVVYKRDENGSWLATVPKVPSAHTHGRTIDQARERIREALSLWVPNAASAELIDDIQLPAGARSAVTKWRRKLAASEAAKEKANLAAKATASGLTRVWDFSYQDAGTLMGLSRQRAHQIATGNKRTRRAARKSSR